MAGPCCRLQVRPQLDGGSGSSGRTCGYGELPIMGMPVAACPAAVMCERDKTLRVGVEDSNTPCCWAAQ